MFLGSWAANRREDRRWRLEAKHKLYVGVAQAGEELRACADECALEIAAHVENSTILAEVLDARRPRRENHPPLEARLEEALERFKLLLPQAAIAASNEVYNAMRAYLVLAETVGAEAGTEADPGYWEESKDLSERHWAVLDAMRADLGFQPRQMHTGWPGQEALHEELRAGLLRAREAREADARADTRGSEHADVPPPGPGIC